MKRTLITSLLILILLSAYGQDKFYDVETINEIRITFQESNWDALLDNLYAAGDEERLTGSIEINGVQYDNVGIRYKGNSSYNSSNAKNPLNIKLDHIISGQNHENFEKLRLSNIFKDPSCIREVLGFEIARKYMPASQANYTKVYINDGYIGLYSNIQDVDDYFDKVHFGDDDALRFKGEIMERGGNAVLWDYLGATTAPYQKWYEAEQDGGWEELIALLDTFNNHTSSVEEVLNVDRHIWMLAFSNLLVHLDAPINNAHNYYICQDEAGQFNPVIWDLNESFGTFSRLSGSTTLSDSEKQTMSPFLNETNPNYPIIGNILSIARYRKMYVAHMKTMIEENFTNSWYTTRANEIQDIIDTEVQADANTFFSYSDFKTNVTSSAQRHIGISELMGTRCLYLLSLPEFTAAAPSISNVIIPDSIAPYSKVNITAEIHDTESAFIKYRHSKGEPFKWVEMADDGQHNDGKDGDNIWGASLTVDASKTHFYIYAENNDAGKFSPERAQQEYYTIEAVQTIEISNSIVINEFSASNSNIRADQYGEYDDWIELYNTTEDEISLSGYFLTDNNELTKWAFPDTSISPQGYLIIWADNDTEQSGLHCNFKLSASGEQIALVNPSLTIVNQLEFMEQTNDISFGLFPNGTGTYQALIPTFSMENTTVYSSIREFDLEQFVIYPNPTHQYFNIKLPDGAIDHEVEIYTEMGQLVMSTNELTIDVNSLSPGVYIYTINYSGIFHKGKVLIKE